MRSLDDLLKESSTLQGHLCGGQILGVRMAIVGCREVNVDEPRGCKKLVAHIEMDPVDRCAMDAIQAVTGCSLAESTLKFLDYGKMGVTFFNLEIQKAVRIVVKNEARPLVASCPGQSLDAEAQRYASLSEEYLFSIQPIKQLPNEELPGANVRRLLCEQCGEGVTFGHEIKMNGRILCIPCTRRGYLPQSEKQAARAAVILVVGRKNAGKTTLIERLVPELSARGCRVGTVKHHHASSPMMVDHEGKDSWRHRRAGARSVALVSPSQVALFRDTEERLPLNDLMEYFDGVDIVLVEGFRSEPIPRIVVSETLRENNLSAVEHQILATICPEKRAGEAPLFKPREIKFVVDLIERKILGRVPIT